MRQLAQMRAAKERIRMERGAAGLLEPEPKMERFFALEFGVRDKLNGSVVWMDLRSARDVARRLAVLLRYYVPGGPT